jgi:hypothetical protein
MQLKKKIQLVKWLKNKKNEDQVWYNNQIKKNDERGKWRRKINKNKIKNKK